MGYKVSVKPMTVRRTIYINRAPAVIGYLAVFAARSATDPHSTDDQILKSVPVRFCWIGGIARAASMSPKRRAEIARKAAKARWSK
jgi:hypothetical protein